MKKVLLITFAMLISITIIASAAEYNDGHYVGYVPDSHGDCVVEVGIVGGNIVNVNIVSPVKLKSNYKYSPAINAFMEYPAKVIAEQNADIDVVAAATSSYTEYNKAVKMALDIASGSYTGSKYYGLTRNYGHGHVLVELTKDGDKVTNVSLITKEDENNAIVTLMPFKGDDYGNKAAKEYFDTFGEKAVKAINAGTNQVDLVSGATHSFNEYNEALRDALAQAGL